MADETTTTTTTQAPTTYFLKLFTKDGQFASVGDKNDLSASITGLDKGTQVNSGDYIGRLSLDTNKYASAADSDPQPVPAFIAETPTTTTTTTAAPTTTTTTTVKK